MARSRSSSLLSLARPLVSPLLSSSSAPSNSLGPSGGPSHEPPPGGSPAPTLETLAPAIEPASQPPDDDEFQINHEPFANDNGDGLTSVTSSVYACTYERCRRYHCFKNGRYPIPNDDIEKDREDLKHAMLMELTDGILFFSPIESPQTIWDIGTGTGTAVGAASSAPSAPSPQLRLCGIDALADS